MLDHNQLDEASTVNFDAATLRIEKDNDEAGILQIRICSIVFNINSIIYLSMILLYVL